MKVTLLSEPQHGGVLTEFFSGHPTIELVTSGAELVIDCLYFDLEEKYTSLQSFESKDAILISNTLTAPATSIARNIGGFKRIIGVPMISSQLASQKTIEYSTPLQQQDMTSNGELLKSLFRKDVEKIGDCVAGIFPRTIAMIINEAAFALQEQVATASDIDMAMKLGTNYPKGPLAWCDEIGTYTIVAILEALQIEYGADRYKVAPLLRLNAEAGKKFFDVQ
ncbi:MAG: 3-hydroxyacyl-CoA dehydrogenase family protein [Bacteroidota bacterium]|nr:3-hydroxyacyl-CoA dehydrogenase family protein [Bacteroidota bacterium]